MRLEPLPLSNSFNPLYLLFNIVVSCGHGHCGRQKIALKFIKDS